MQTKRFLLGCLLGCSFAAVSMAQQNDKLTLSGSIQSDMLVPQTDNSIGANSREDFLTNTYADLRLNHQYFEAGARVEYLEHPLPGFENDFKGWGVPNFFVKGKLGDQELTLGTFYEQFGSGFILRSYEERSLGIDNSLLGARLLLKPAKGVQLKALCGKQRRYWHWNSSLVSGADAELSLNEWMPALQQRGTTLTLAASWVGKHETPGHLTTTRMVSDTAAHTTTFYTYELRQPRYVNAFDVRASLQTSHLSLLAEYARKSADPSFANGYIYGPGSVAMVSASYSQGPLSMLLQAKRSENMSFKSRRDEVGIASAVNHLPAFTQDHTYALAALYPYATQLADGEWAYQAELGYHFKRKTALGGKYGMNLKLNYSYVRAIDRRFADGQQHTDLGGSTALAGTDGYTSSFFKWGSDTYYQDLDLQLSRRFSRQFKLNLMYMNQRYNKTKVEGHGGMIHSDIFVADALCQLAPKAILRLEGQYLSTRQDEGDWLFALAELSLAPHWMITLSDQWNCGDTAPVVTGSAAGSYTNTHHHYYQGLLTYTTGSHRMQLGYGRTRAGYNCSGGVCRWIPAQRGFTLSYNYNF